MSPDTIIHPSVFQTLITGVIGLKNTRVVLLYLADYGIEIFLSRYIFFEISTLE